MSNEKIIWEKFISAGLTTAGAAALMGNLYAESALNSKNLQNVYEKKLGYTDDSYTQAVDDGSYKNFVHDSAGYGLAQWTFYSRKQKLLDCARQQKVSVGDLDMQINFLISELKSDYPAVYKALCTAQNVRTASDKIMCDFENPADQSEAAKAKRAAYGQKFFDEFAATSARKKSNMELAQEVLAGMWGNGDDRKNRLTDAGYIYADVQAAVNKILASEVEIPVENPVESVEKKSLEVSLTVSGKTYSGTLTAE